MDTFKVESTFDGGTKEIAVSSRNSEPDLASYVFYVF